MCRKLIKKHVFIFGFQFTGDEDLRVKLTLQLYCVYTEEVSSRVLCVQNLVWSSDYSAALDLQLASTTNLSKIVRFLLTNSVHTPFCIHGIYNHSTSTVNPHANFHCGATIIMIELYSIWCMRQHYASVVYHRNYSCNFLHIKETYFVSLFLSMQATEIDVSYIYHFEPLQIVYKDPSMNKLWSLEMVWSSIYQGIESLRCSHLVHLLSCSKAVHLY